MMVINKGGLCWVLLCAPQHSFNHTNPISRQKTMEYRRARKKGGTYFFTVVTFDRKEIFKQDEHVILLRKSFKYVKERHPFSIDAFVLLPDHLHCIWTLPQGDHDFSNRWRLIKSHFTRNCGVRQRPDLSQSRKKKKEKAVWQRQFWEHCIRDEEDFMRHVEYVHYNPVKHGLVKMPVDWPYSSFRRFVHKGLYDRLWGSGDSMCFKPEIVKE